ncbi:MAG TPA: EAL domain-containing protein, partial [Isosphaeraceae bacterium]|nr:EAL domain-containing protein [Isosphaeraceae bacterium]
DTLKIDRSFVHRMDQDAKDLEIVQTILMLARNLSMDVIAEGVETPHQRDRLQTLGCEHGQGYYFSRAMQGQDAEALIARSRRMPGHLHGTVSGDDSAAVHTAHFPVEAGPCR